MSTASPTLKDVSDRLANNPSRDDLIGVIETLVTEAERAHEEREQLRQENEQLREELSEVRDENDELRDELGDVRELLDSTRREQAEIRSDVHEVKQTQDGSEESDSNPAEIDETPTPQAGSPAVPEPETSLGQAIRLPEHVAKENLTKNQQKARSLAKDIHQYATSIPAGYRLGASEMRRVLSAQEDGATIHGQTLARVRDFLVRLGGDHVELKESRNGTTSVIFDEDFVRRVVAWANENGGHDVVSRGGVSG
jgi:DNA repair exonuclease SbcCD ATPase subunit